MEYIEIQIKLQIKLQVRPDRHGHFETAGLQRRGDHLIGTCRRILLWIIFTHKAASTGATMVDSATSRADKDARHRQGWGWEWGWERWDHHISLFQTFRNPCRLVAIALELVVVLVAVTAPRLEQASRNQYMGLLPHSTNARTVGSLRGSIVGANACCTR